MKYKINKIDNTKISIDITLNEKEWQAEVENAYNKYKSRYNIEGFRKGKAPRKVIEKQYGEKVFFEDALSDSFYKLYFEILQKEPSIDPIADPSLNIKKIEADGVELVAEVVLKPEVKLEKYTGFNLKKSEVKVTDQELQDAINKALEQGARFVETDKPSSLGNTVNIDFVGSIDGVEFEGGNAKDFDLELGSGNFIPGFEDQLVGKKTGDKVDVKVSFPTNYHATELAGKPTVFAVTINAVKEKQLPKLDDEFVSNTSDFETVDAYKSDLKAKLLEEAERKTKVEFENKIVEKIIENLDVEVPEVLVEQEIDNTLHNLEHRLMYQGLTLENYLQYLGVSMEQFRNDRREESRKGAKVRLALQHIIKQEKLEETQDDIDNEIKKLATQVGVPYEEYKKSIDDHMMGHLRNDIVMDKLLNFLVEKNTAK